MGYGLNSAESGKSLPGSGHPPDPESVLSRRVGGTGRSHSAHFPMSMNFSTTDSVAYGPLNNLRVEDHPHPSVPAFVPKFVLDILPLYPLLLA